MRRTSACCLHAPDPLQAGFTLLELLLVLALVALATGIVAPALTERIRQSEQLAMIERLEDVLAGLPSRARDDQTDTTWTADRLVRELATERPVAVVLREPLRYNARGLAQGGEVALVEGGRQLAAWSIEPHVGRPRRTDRANHAP